MEFFGPIFTFVIDKSNKGLQKALLVIGTLCILIFLDNLFGFSYFYNLSNKINIASQIHTILKDKVVDLETKQQLVALNKELFERISFTEWLYNYYSDIFKSNSVYFVLLTWLTSSCAIILFMTANAVGAYSALKNPISYIMTPPLKTLKKVLLVELALLILSIITTFVFLLIPVIYHREYFNYILNFLINVLLLRLVALLPYFNKDNTTSKVKTAVLKS